MKRGYGLRNPHRVQTENGKSILHIFKIKLNAIEAKSQKKQHCSL